MNIDIYTFDDKRQNIIDLASQKMTGGIFTEACENYLEATKQYEVTSAKIEAYTEATERELAINIAKAELKCFEEDGTMDDLVYLEEAAEDGAISKLKKLIDACIAAFKEWISNIKTKVIKHIASSEARSTLKTAEKKIKLNPILAKKKVAITSTDKTMSIINTYKSKIDRISAKIVVKGIVSEQNMKTLNNLKEDFRSDFKSSIAGSAAVKTITVSALVAQLSSDIDKLPSFIDNMESQHTSVLERLKGTINEDAAAAASAATNACANFRSELAREEVNAMIDSVMEKMKVLKSSVSKNVEVKPIKESVNEFNPVFDEDDCMESFEDDLDTSFEHLEDIFNN